MKKLLISIFITILFTSNVSAKDFFYKSKQETEKYVRYQKIITDTVLIDRLEINKSNQKKSLKVKGLINKHNPDNKYDGELSGMKAGNKNIVTLKLTEKQKNKNLELNIQTEKQSEQVFFSLLNDKKEFLNILNESNFNLKINNDNDTSFIFAMLNIDNKSKLYKKLKKLKSNKIKEVLDISKRGNNKKLDKYVLDWENVAKFEITSDLDYKDGVIVFKNINIKTTVQNNIEALQEMSKYFKLNLEKGINLKEIENIEIKL